MHFAEGLAETVAWYRDNTAWWEPIRSGDYREYYERQYGTQIRKGAVGARLRGPHGRLRPAPIAPR